MGRNIFSLILLAGAVALAQPSTRQARITLEDLASAAGIGQTALSPDGKWFAIASQGQIALVPSAGGWPTTLTTTPGGKSGLDWSPDGSEIAFVSHGAVWSVPAAGGQPLRLTDGVRGAGDPRSAADRNPQWSPNGRWLLLETGRRGNSDLAVVSRDGRWHSLLTRTPADEGAAVWSPDGRRIAFVERSAEHFSGRLLLADFDESSGRFQGEPRILYTAAEDRGGGWAIRRVAFSPDGTRLALSLQDSGWDKLYLLPVAGGPPQAVTSSEGDDESPVFSPDGKWLAFVSNRTAREERHIWLLPLGGGPPRRLTSARAVIEGGVEWSADSQSIYFHLSSSLDPGSLYSASLNAQGEAREILSCRPKNFSAAALPAPEVVHYTSPDGTPISAILNRPRGFKPGVRWPAVLWIHGGPEGQDTLGWDAWPSYLAQRGYLVLRPNYRGSSGYGERFRNLNVEDSGGGEVEDVAAGVRYLVDQGLADPLRVGIDGGSHGGTMVAYAVTKKPELFHAGIELYGVVDRATFLDRTNRSTAIRWARKMGGSPAEKPAVYRKANVLPDVPKIQSPLLIMHGEDDPQVPPFESRQFADALSKAGKPHVYVTYPKELHGFVQREHRIDAWRKQAAFLDLYLQPHYGRGITSTAEIELDEK